MSIYFCLLYMKIRGCSARLLHLKYVHVEKKICFISYLTQIYTLKTAKLFFPDLINDRNVLSINEVYCVSIVNDFFKIIHINVN